MELHQINPHIRYAKLHLLPVFPQDSCYCYDCRLFFVKQGHLRIECGGTLYELFKNTAIFIPPGSCYRFVQEKDDNPLEIMIFNFDLTSDFSHLKSSLGTALKENFDPEKVLRYPLPEEFSHIVCQSAPQIYEPLEKCEKEFLYKNKYFRETGSSLLKWSLISLLREVSVAADSKIVSQVIEYIHTHYADPALNNTAIAEHFNYHPYYLSQLMKHSTGHPLRTHLSHYRIRVAKNHLLTTDWDVNTIAWKCGFNSPAYFIKQFKHAAGVTPKQYRKFHASLVF